MHYIYENEYVTSIELQANNVDEMKEQGEERRSEMEEKEESRHAVDSMHFSVHPLKLFSEAVDSGRNYFQDWHVLPYLAIAEYRMVKLADYKGTLHDWSLAAAVLSKFVYYSPSCLFCIFFIPIFNDFLGGSTYSASLLLSESIFFSLSYVKENTCLQK